MFFSTAKSAYAQGQEICEAAGSNFSALCRLRLDTGAGGIVGTIVQVMLLLAVVLSLFFLLFGGIRWISSGGDKGKIDQARSTLTAALIGLVISLSAFFILNLVVRFITGSSFTTFKIPRLID